MIKRWLMRCINHCVLFALFQFGLLTYLNPPNAYLYKKTQQSKHYNSYDSIYYAIIIIIIM